MELIDNLKWRYATKKFNPYKKVTDDDLQKLKEAIQLSASSYGLQHYKILIIEDKKTREALKTASWNQEQIIDCSHLFVFCNYSTIKDASVDDYILLKAKTQSIDVGSIMGYGEFIKGKLAEKTEVEKSNWSMKQTYLALGNLLIACSELKIDACPMEGFEPEQYNQILGLKEKGLNTAVIATIGYRLPEDQNQYEKKVRKSMALLFEQT